ncbi:MAG: hypothetical protein Q4D58_01265 [Synergistaceae bacterium]|nr:hypothetical protein [Synergistaceae bacterium]
MTKEAARRALSRRLCLFLILSLLILFRRDAAEAAAAPAMRIAATSPLLCEIADFISGGRARVRALSRFGESGELLNTARPLASEIIIAFDPEEAERRGLKLKNKNLRLLYDKVRMTEEQRRSAFFDPAMLPFVARGIMKIISAEDQENYAYYQRRLAEFQSRIDSTMGVGRHLLSDTRLLDLTGAEGAWVRSSIEGALRPPESVWKSWLNGDVEALNAALAEASRRGWLLLLDPWTPAPIRAAATAFPYRLTLPAPPQDTEFFIFLHDIFTMISNRVKGAQSSGKKTGGI